MTKRKIIITIAAVILIVVIGIVVAVITKNSSTEENTEKLKTISVSEVTRSVFYSPQYPAAIATYCGE